MNSLFVLSIFVYLRYKHKRIKKQLFKAIAKINKLLLPSFGKKRLDMSKAKKWQLAIIGWRAFITKNAINP